MSDLSTYYAFVVKCRICGGEVEVGGTKEFNEKGSGERTAYYHPATHKLCGVSEGTGDTFECLPCHVVKWADSQSGDEERF